MARIALEDNRTHFNRFQIRSSTSKRLYILAQRRSTQNWECSCPKWRFKLKSGRRSCKHLSALNLPADRVEDLRQQLLPGFDESLAA